jgi:type IV pilus assembly protein PilE
MRRSFPTSGATVLSADHSERKAPQFTGSQASRELENPLRESSFRRASSAVRQHRLNAAAGRTEDNWSADNIPNDDMQVSTYKRTMDTRAAGFTLIELIVVMIVVAILAAIAIPNYSQYVQRGHRSSAQAYISDLASRQAQFFLDRRVYADNVAALNVPAPAEIANRYVVAIAANGGPPATFIVTATPTGPQSDDRCGALTINQAGAKGAAATRCW